MKTTKYLYDVDPSIWGDMTYLAVSIDRKACAKALKAKLSAEAKECINDQERYVPLLSRYTSVEKAIAFNQNLIDEVLE